MKPRTGPDWALGIQHLKTLHEALSQARRMALETATPQNAGAADLADALPHKLAEVAQLMALHLPSLQAAAKSAPAPAEAKLLLQQLGQELDALRALHTRLSARTQRALEVLFPAEQVRAYNRLGARSPFGASGASGYLKA